MKKVEEVKKNSKSVEERKQEIKKRKTERYVDTMTNELLTWKERTFMIIDNMFNELNSDILEIRSKLSLNKYEQQDFQEIQRCLGKMESQIVTFKATTERIIAFFLYNKCERYHETAIFLIQAIENCYKSMIEPINSLYFNINKLARTTKKAIRQRLYGFI